MIRIGVDIRPLAHPSTGIGRYTSEMLKRLIALSNSEIKWYLYADRPIECDFLENQQVKVTSFPKWNRLLSLWRTQICFSWWARGDKLDLFWSPRHHLPLFLPSGIRKIVTLHDLVWKLFPETMLTANCWVEKILMPPSLRCADEIICVSEETQREMNRHFPGFSPKSCVIYEGKSRHEITDSEWKMNKYFLFVGTLEPRKNLNRILSAFRLFIDSGDDEYELIVVGGKGWNHSVEKIIYEHDLSSRVRLLNSVDDSTLHCLYQNAIALLLVSLYEGFGLTALEAMQYGVPVIGSNRSSIPEVVGEGGILVDPLKAEEIAEAMAKLVRDSELRQKLGVAAEQQAKKFSWDTAVLETLALFRRSFAQRNN